MLRNYRIQAGSQPANQSPSRGASSDTKAPMLSATSSNNHSLFSFGRSNGSSASAASKSTSFSHRADHDERRSSYNDESDAASASAATDDNTSDVANHTAAGFDFLPSVSFDDLQSSLESASTEFRLAQFPSPSGQGPILTSKAAVEAMDAHSDSSYSDQRPDNANLSTPKRGPVAAAAAAAAASVTLPGSAPATARTAVATQPLSTSTSTSTTDGPPARKAAPILRRPSVTTRTNNGSRTLPTSASSAAALDASSVSSSMSGAAGPARQRRQSHYPPVSNSNIAKPPRKSVGPGIFDPDYVGVGRTSSRRRPSVASDSDPAVPASARSSIDGGSRLGSGGGDATRGASSSRATKARSFQPPSSRASVSSTGTDHAKSSSRPTANRLPRGASHSSSYGNFNFSTGQTNNSSASGGGSKGALGGSGFSAGGGKRMSMAPVLHTSQHATGLGARTVSPTDTRRMKRRSIMPNSNGSNANNGADSTNNTTAANATSIANNAASSRDTVPPVLPAPLPSAAEIRASSRSPSMLPRKTSTPSSSRTTPDPNRKSYSSGFSAGSSLSFYTVRSSTGSIQPRLPQGTVAVSGTGATGSRLPAPKVMGMPSSAPSMEDDEDVPPVPAIPKAYESPKEPPVDLAFFEKRRSNLALDTSSTHSSSTASLSLEPAAKVQRKPSTRATRDFSRPTQATAGQGTSSGHSKKNLQPLSLPPMNLTPLSTSTTAKIAAFQAQGAAPASSDRNMSPPPSRVITKTPTTPMTASKGSFFSRHRNDDRADLATTVRSSSSVHHHARSESATAGSDEYIFAAAGSRKTPSHKHSVSPFLPASTPKGNSAMDASYAKLSRTPSGMVAGDESFASSSLSVPAPPPIPPSASSTFRKPSGPRAPAPTPSRAFAPIETASSIVAANDAMRIGSDATAPGSSFAGFAPKSPPPLANPDDPPTPSSIGSSLRRKLSLSWKRNNSKSSLGGSIDKQAEAGLTDSKPHLFSHHRHASSHDKDKHDGMPPPPRIPKSATASQLPSSKSGSNLTSATLPRTVGKPAGAYLATSRRKSSASSLNAILTNEKTGDHDRKKDMVSTSMPQTADVTMNGAHLQALQQHKMLRAKSSATSVHPHQNRGDVWSVNLDKDDLVAEEEMRKLGGRRKETELAARTLDALRQRATAKGRVSPQEAARIAMLNLYERGEIVDFNDVYFCGTQNAAKVVGNQNAESPNFGYDDERGDYTIVPGDHLAYRYEIIDLLGKGSFGQVVRCIDHKAGALVAVKIIRNKKRFHQQALVEVNILRKLREWDPQQKHSMVNFTDSFYFRGHLCISTELLDMNLYEFIKANSFRGFSLKLIRRFTKQILSSLNLLKQHKVIHCDLKPENILLRHPMFSEIKVIDFGSSCFENEKVYTYIQSRFYRSPEVILGMTYGMPIDMWSLGCILAELYTGVPIFPGENEQEQLACIMEVFGPPEKHLIEKSTRKKLFFDSNGKPRLTVPSKGRRRRPSSKTLQQAIKCDDEAFLDFLARCLRWDPERRLKPDEAIRHEFITGQKSILPPRGSHHHSGSTRDGSPIRRNHTVSTSGTTGATTSGSGPRPLPEPPGGNQLKLGSGPTLRAVGAGGTSRESLGGPRSTVMASTAASSRRASAVAGSLTTAGGSLTKRTSAAGVGAGTSSVNASNSNLPRAAGRVVSGGGLSSGGTVTRQTSSDLAAAGAAAAMTRRGA